MKWIGEAAGQYWNNLPHNACASSVQVRTSEDVLGPLATLYFTGVLAYIHLLWIRGESILDWRPFFFPFSPLTIVFQHALALITISLRFIISKIRQEEEPFQASIPLRFLFGHVSPATEAATETTHPPSEKGGISQAEPLQVKDNEFSTILGPAKTLGLILQFAGLIFYLVYCVISIKFFFRRYTHASNSLINADYTILQLSLAGILLVLLNLPHTSLTPLSLFTSPVPVPSAAYRRANHRFHEATIFFRDSSSPTLYSPRYSPALFSYLQQFRQLFFLEAISILLIATNFGTAPPIPLAAIIANYDSFGIIPLPQLRADYYWRVIGGQVVFALFMLHALHGSVKRRKFWEKDVMAAQQALVDEHPASTSRASDHESEQSDTQLPTSAPASSTGEEQRTLWSRARDAVAAFWHDPLAFTPSVGTMLPYVIAGSCMFNLWDRLWPEVADWEKWPADIPCPNQWWDPAVGEWERVWKWWSPGAGH